MLRKLFYYEMKNCSRLLLLLHGFCILVSLCSFGIQGLTAIHSNPLLLFLVRLMPIIVIICVAFFTYFYFGQRFYKTTFTDEGYLTNTLPVTPGQILNSRFLTALLWSFLDAAILIFCLSLTMRMHFVKEFLYQLGAEGVNNSFMLLFWGLIFIGLLLTLISIFCSVAIGNLFSGHKVMGSVITFFFLNFVLQFVALIPLLFYLPEFLRMPSGSYALLEFQTLFPDAYHAMFMVFIWETLLYLIVCVVLYLLTWRVMDKNLNLE